MDSHFGVGINEHMHIDRSDGSDGAQCETEVHADERREKATNGCDFSAARMFCNYEILSIYYFFSVVVWFRLEAPRVRKRGRN